MAEHKRLGKVFIPSETRNGVYIIRNIVNGMHYIGSVIRDSGGIAERLSEHLRALGGGYHYCPYLQNAWNKYGSKNFRFDVWKVCENAREEEQWYLDAAFRLGILYNSSDKAVVPCSGWNKGKPRSEGHCRNLSLNHHDVSGKNNPMYGKEHSVETKKKISEALSGSKHPMYGKPTWNKGKKGFLVHSEETRRKISEANSGRILSEEHKRKLSEAHFGKKHTEETKRKMSEDRSGEKHPNWGKNLSEETRRKISEAKSVTSIEIMDDKYKFCHNCGWYKHLESGFGKDKKRFDGYTCLCKECKNRLARERYWRNK